MDEGKNFPRLFRYSCWVFLFCLTGIFISCGEQLPQAHIGDMEANNPWIIFDPKLDEGYIIPCEDKHDPNIVYLIFEGKVGDAVKIDLRTKKVSPYHFDVSKWEDVENYTNKYNLGYHWEGPGPLWIEFRGTIKKLKVSHMFGDPVPNQPGTRVVSIRSGYYYIMDEHDGNRIELLRVKTIDSELDFGQLGEAFLSPNKDWVIFTLGNLPQRTFIFNRKNKTPLTFPYDHDDQTQEIYKESGAKMGSKPQVLIWDREEPGCLFGVYEPISELLVGRE